MSVLSDRMTTAQRGIPYAYRFYSRIARGLPVGASIDVSERCPNGCRCYRQQQIAEQYDIPVDDIAAINDAGKRMEANDETIVSFVTNLRNEGYLMAMFVGLEPYVRVDLLKKLAGIMPWSWVATSGVFPLVHLDRTTHFVSVDGADAKTHDALRRSPGLFSRIVTNLNAARFRESFPVFVHMVVNSVNQYQMCRLVEYFCVETKLADGVVFSFHTPMMNGSDSDLAMSGPSRDLAVDSMLSVRDSYPKFVCMTEGMIRSYSSSAMVHQMPSSCPTSQYVSSYAGNLEQLPQCIFGPGADCSGCGCVITSLLGQLSWPPNLRAARVAARVIPLR